MHRSGTHKYDVALSFAGEQREYVDQVATCLRAVGIDVFYDQYEQVNLWGKDLYAHLNDVYRKHARYCVMFASADYARKAWPNHERAAAQARAFEENEEYILPARFDDSEIPGVNPTVGYVDCRVNSPAELANLISAKLGQERSGAPSVATLGPRSPALSFRSLRIAMGIMAAPGAVLVVALASPDKSDEQSSDRETRSSAEIVAATSPLTSASSAHVDEALAAPPTAVAVAGSLSERANRSTSLVQQARSDIDENVWGYLRRSTKVTLGEAQLKDNDDGTFDVYAQVTWSVEGAPLVATLGNYFWGYSSRPFDSGEVDLTDHIGTTVPGLKILKHWNDESAQKLPYSADLFQQLVRRQARIRVRAGKHSALLTIASGRKCFVGCEGAGSDQFHIQFSNVAAPPKIMMEIWSDEQNPVRLRRIPRADLAAITKLSYEVEIAERR